MGTEKETVEREEHPTAKVQSYLSGRGPTASVELKEEDYLIVYRQAEGKVFGSVDVDFKNHIIRVYDDRPWKIHHMDSNSRTIQFPVLDKS